MFDLPDDTEIIRLAKEWYSLLKEIKHPASDYEHCLSNPKHRKFYKAEQNLFNAIKEIYND